MVVATLALVALAALPSVWPERFGLLNPLTIDTDPENMLSTDEPVRVFHDDMKEQFSLYDMVVVGVVNESDPDGVFNVGSLRRIYELTEYASTLRWPDPDNPGRQEGVVEEDMLALSRVDNIEQEGAARFVSAGSCQSRRIPATRRSLFLSGRNAFRCSTIPWSAPMARQSLFTCR